MKKEPPFKGVNWSYSTQRPGCMDHLQHPSRRGDERVMHTGKMIHAASNVRLINSPDRLTTK